MAGDQLGRLRARLEASSDGVTAGVNKAKGEFKGFEGAAKKTIGSVKGLLGNLGAAIAGFSFASAIQDSLDSLDQLDELSTAYGVSTQSLQSLSLAAKQSGLSMEDLARSTGKLYKSLAENPDAFDAIGLSAKQLSALDLPQKLGMIGDALFRIESEEQRVAAAMQIFGKSGADILPMLSEGMAGLARSAEEVRAAGGIFTDEEIAKAVAANDSLDRAKTSLKAIITDLAVTFAPAIEAVANATAKLAEVFQAAQEKSAELGGGWGAWVGERTSSPLLKWMLTGGADVAGAAGNSYTPAQMAEIRRIREASEATAANMSTPTW